MTAPTFYHSSTPEHRNLAKKCEQLISRFLRYRELHPVTVRGVCRLAGIVHHQPISEFFSLHRVTISERDYSKIDDYLKERGF
jgi:hypothetical protein